MKTITNKNLSILTILVAIIVLLFVTAKSFNSSSGLEANLATVKIGGAFALSGDASTVPWGEAARRGAELAIEDINAKRGINGHKVELIIEDMQSSSKGSVSAVTKLIDIDHVNAVVLSWLDVYQGSAPLASLKGVPIITPDGGIEAINGEKVNPGVFSTWYRTDVKAQKIVNYMADNGVRTLSLLYQNDSYYTDFSARVLKYAKLRGIDVALSEKVNEGTTGLPTQVLKIQNSKPDAVLFALYNEKDLYSFLKIHSQSFPEVQLYGDELVQDHYALEKYKGLYEDTIYFHASAPESDFSVRFKARFGSDPIFGAGPAYDSVMILANLLREKGALGSQTPEQRIQMYDSYLRSKSFNTVSYGEMTFDEIGGVKTQNNQFELLQVKNNQAVKID